MNMLRVKKKLFKGGEVMDDLIKTSNNLEVQETEVSEVLYGKVLNINRDTLSIDFKGMLNQVFQYINIADVVDKIKKGTDYVVQIPTEFQAGLDMGEYWIMENSKNGKLWPTLMELGANGKNKIVTPLPVKMRGFIDGNPAKDIANNYNNIYMQQQMNELAGLIETTLDTVKRIEYGQMDDRIGLLNAGKQAIILALSQKDEASRSTALLQGINNINIAQNQIAETFKRRVNDFKALPKTKAMQFLREFAKTGYLEAKDDEYNQIQEYFNLYLQATNMLASTYSIIDDMDNAQRVFDMSAEQIKSIDFITLKTIEYAHKDKEFEKIYENTIDYIIAEKQLCLENAKEYDCLAISVSGDKLLEVIANGKPFSESEDK